MSSSTVYWAGATSKDPASFPNQGIRSTIDVVDLTTLPVTDLMAVWVAETMLGGNLWFQTGYYGGQGNLEQTPFLQIWNLSLNRAILTDYGPTVVVGPHQWSIYLTTGGTGTVWAAAVDGAVLGTYDFGVTQAGSYGAQLQEVLVEAQPSTGALAPFPLVSSPMCMETLIGGSWDPVLSAQALETAPYGVEGVVQNPALIANQIAVGSSLAAIPAGTSLWSTVAGAKPTSFTVKPSISNPV